MKLLEYIAVVISTVYVVKHTSLFAIIDKLLSLIPGFKYAWACPPCVAFWLGLFVAILCHPVTLFNYEWINVVTAGFICHFSMTYVESLINSFNRRS